MPMCRTLRPAPSFDILPGFPSQASTGDFFVSQNKPAVRTFQDLILAPVSYTHLDVYKRQAVGRAQRVHGTIDHLASRLRLVCLRGRRNAVDTESGGGLGTHPQ